MKNEKNHFQIQPPSISSSFHSIYLFHYMRSSLFPFPFIHPSRFPSSLLSFFCLSINLKLFIYPSIFPLSFFLFFICSSNSSIFHFQLFIHPFSPFRSFFFSFVHQIHPSFTSNYSSIYFFSFFPFICPSIQSTLLSIYFFLFNQPFYPFYLSVRSFVSPSIRSNFTPLSPTLPIRIYTHLLL